MGQERLWRSSAREDDPTTEALARVAPGKRTRVEVEAEIDQLRSGDSLAAAGKRTRSELEEARVEDPARAMQYASWMLSAERGWSARAPVQRRASDSVDVDAGSLATAFAHLEGGGGAQPLPEELARELRATLGLDPSLVRLHVDDRAAEAASILHARAFTIGNDIYFAAGAYDPSNESGLELLAHEAAHVAQHQRGVSMGSRAVSRPDEAHELAADELAHRFLVQRRQRAQQALHAVHADDATPRQPSSVAASARPLPEWAGVAAPAAAPASSSLTAHRAPAPAPAASKAAAPLPIVVDLLGKSDFEPTAQLAAHIDKAGEAGADVRVKLGKLTGPGVIRVRKLDGRYVTVEDKPQLVPLTSSLFIAKAIQPMLRVRIGASGSSAITGFVTVAGAAEAQALAQALIANPAAIGLAGFTLPSLSLTNRLENGALDVATPGNVAFDVGGWLHGEVGFGLANTAVTLDAQATVKVKGLQEGQLHIKRDAKGQISGVVDLALALGDKFTGKATARYERGDVTIKGQLAYHSEKLNGSLNLIAADAAEAEQLTRAQIDPGAVAPPPSGKKGPRAIAGWGDLDFAFTEWLTGKAKVVYGPTGHITVIGKIAPPKQLDLMKTPKGVRQPILPKFNVEMKYGIPYLADVHVGVGVSLAATAGIGPIYMTDLAIEGIYSTDPKVMNAFSITGTLRAQADAGLELDVTGYAGLTLLGHSVNVGVGVTGRAGLKAYAEARSTLGFREKAAPGAGKKGEYYLKGHMEMVAQPVLSLGGRLFVEVDSPWWSPAGDHTWNWPIGSLEYPIPAQFGIGADVDYVVGSDKWPEVKLTKPSFDPGKFVDTMMANRLPAKSGRDKQSKTGTFSGVAPAHPTATPPPVAKTTPADPKLSSTPQQKGAQGMQTDAQKANTPKSPDVATRWNAGMKELGELKKRAEKDPESKAEITQHLGAIKQKHGFTKLEPERSGDFWLVDAEMNPSKKGTQIRAEKEKPEDKKDGEKKEGDKKDGEKEFSPMHLEVKMHGGGKEHVHVKPSKAGGDGPLELWIANQKGVKALDDVSSGPIGQATNPAGVAAVDNAIVKVHPHLSSIEKVKTAKGKLADSALGEVKNHGIEVVKVLSDLGTRLRSKSLDDAAKLRLMDNKKLVEFQPMRTGKKSYRAKFLSEMKTQLAKQQAGLAKLTIDKWLINQALFNPSEVLSTLHEEARQEVLRLLKERCDEGLPRANARLAKLQARKEAADEALKTLQASASGSKKKKLAAMEEAKKAAAGLESTEAEIQGYIDAMGAIEDGEEGNPVDANKLQGSGGREDGQRKWADQHRAAKEALVKMVKSNDPLVKEWKGVVTKVGQLAVLHDPDQIAGGDGDIEPLPVIQEPKDSSDPDGHAAWNDYLVKVKAHLGLQKINSSIGSQWKERIGKLREDVKNDHDTPDEVHGIRTLNVELSVEKE